MADLTRVTLMITGTRFDLEKFADRVKGIGSNGTLYPILLSTLLPDPDYSPERSGVAEDQWRLEHWGTTRDLDWSNQSEEIEWNWSGIAKASQLSYEFDVAWNAPDAWVRFAKTQFPRLNFELLE